MKNVFGIDVTENRSNETADGEVFVTAKISEAQQQALEREMDAAEATEKKMDLPIPLLVLYYLSILATVICLGGLLRSRVGLSQAYKNAPGIFYIGAAGILVWIVLGTLKRYRQRTVGSSEETQLETRRMQAVEAGSYQALGVPETATDMDVLTFCYKIKNDAVKVVPLSIANYANMQVKAFVRDGMLCLADLYRCVYIPLDEITGIRSEEKRISVFGWNKPTAFNQGEFKQYKITANDMGALFLKSYCVLTAEHNGEEYEVFFPPYEQPVLEKLCQ